VALVGRAMVRNVETAMRYGYLDVEEGQLISPAQAKRMAPSDVCLLVTGSQGEPCRRSPECPSIRTRTPAC
jgi:ribonuclease J